MAGVPGQPIGKCFHMTKPERWQSLQGRVADQGAGDLMGDLTHVGTSATTLSAAPWATGGDSVDALPWAGALCGGSPVAVVSEEAVV